MKKYYVELVSYEISSKDIRDSHEINFFNSLEDARNYFEDEVYKNTDENYGYILGLSEVEFNEDGKIEEFEVLESIDEK